MKTKLLISLSAVFLFFMPNFSFAQAPNLGSTAGFALFTADGGFTNIGNDTYVIGKVGNHVGEFSAFAPGTLVGEKHVKDELSTTAATDVLTAYSDLFSLTCGVVLDTLLGTNQVLTPNIYCIGSATTLKGDLILNAQGNPDALFIFKINGALSTSTFANVVLSNQASLKNVYWQVGGAFSLGDSSVFRGTVIADGAINLLEASALYGRGLSRAGAISLHNNKVTVPANGVATGIASFSNAHSVSIAPNPFNLFTTIALNDASKTNNYKVKIYNVLGSEVMNADLTKQLTTLNTSNLHSGIYFYKVMENNKLVQSGKMISKQ